MGFVWVHADSFLRCVASPFHYFVTSPPQWASHLAGAGLALRCVYGALLVAVLVEQ